MSDCERLSSKKVYPRDVSNEDLHELAAASIPFEQGPDASSELEDLLPFNSKVPPP